MPNGQYLICYDLNEAMENQVLEHPSAFLKKLGIGFQSFSWDCALNQCIFKGCTNMPAQAPSHFSVLRYYEN
jgi:hypothetical protein